jgi:hypothetical protein
MRKIAAHTGSFPDGLYLKDVVLNPSEHKIGGYADIFQGSFKGRTVAIKRLRTYVALGDDKITCHKVRLTVCGLKFPIFKYATDSRSSTNVSS